MKIKSLLLVFLVFITSSLAAQSYSQYFDGADTSAESSIPIYFDSDTSNVWQIGNPQKTIFDSAATQPNAILTDTINYYPSNDTSRFIVKFNNFGWDYGISALQWKQKLDMDSGYDGGIIEFSFDPDSSWQNVFNNPNVYNFYGFQVANQDTLVGGEFAFSGTDSTWRDIWLCFDLSWQQQFQDTLFIRFTFQSDSVDNSKEGWIIDNMLAHVTIMHTVNEIKPEKYLNVYPNPASDIIYIETQKLQEFHIIEQMVLVNSTGQVVDEWKNIPTKFFINTKKYSTGLYHLKIKTNIKSETIPMVIHHNQ